MECRDARRWLAVDLKTLPESVRADARAHLAGCAACQACLDRLGAAILSAAEDEIPCAECRAWLDRYVALELAGADPARAFALVHAHLARCPECADDRRFLVASLRALEDDGAAEPAAYPRLSVGFARAAPPARRRAGLRGAGRLLGERWRTLADGLRSPWLSRGAWGTLAALVVLAFAGLIAVRPDLRARVVTLVPGPDGRATATAAAAATQTMASAMGQRWDERAAGTGTAAGARPGGSGAGGATATATLAVPSGATLERLAATRAARGARDRAARLTPTVTLTPTLAATLTPTLPPATPRPAQRDEPTAAPPPATSAPEPPPVNEPPPEPTPSEPGTDPYP